MISAKQVQSAKDEAIRKLHVRGIRDRFTVRVREPKQADWVAMYRGGTQFTGQGRGPIFWVSGRTDEVVASIFREEGVAHTDQDVHDALVGSMLHEYGHVIAEWASRRSPALAAMIRAGWPGEHFSGRPWDEEEFAEDFSRWLAGRFVYSPESLDRIATAYAEEVFEPLDAST